MKQVFKELGPWFHAGLSFQVGRMVDGAIRGQWVRSCGVGGIAEGDQIAEGDFCLSSCSHRCLSPGSGGLAEGGW